MAFPPTFIDELVARNPIEDVVGQYVQLKRSGANYFGLCPFHGEKTASFSVAPAKQIYYCFGCHKGGGVINFIMDIENLSYPDAVRFLAKRVNLEVPEDEQYQSRYKQQERLWRLCKQAARYFHAQLKADTGREARAYLHRRGLDWATVTKFGIGYAPEGWHNLIPAMKQLGFTEEELIAADLAGSSEKNGKKNVFDRFRNRIIFPLIDLRGNVIGFSGRALDKNDKAKYINPRETVIFSKRKYLFAMNLVKNTKRDFIIVCEGPMDAIACHQFGFDCAVASQGTALTEDQVNVISKYTDQVVMTYDNDAAGQNATQRAITMFEKAGVRVRILRLKDAKDADEFLHKFGPEPFEVLLKGSAGQADYRLDTLRREFDLEKDEDRVAFSAKAADLISTFPSAVERELYAGKAAKLLNISLEAMQMEIQKAWRRRQKQQRRREERKNLTPAYTSQPAVKGLRYENIRSARAEEDLLRQVLKEPRLFDADGGLTGNDFSAPVLGRAYDALRARYKQGLNVSLAVLEDFTPEELTHLSGIAGNTEPFVSEQAFTDCVRIVKEERRKAGPSGDQEDLMALRKRLMEQKGYGG